jgi:hypothetical protein
VSSEFTWDARWFPPSDLAQLELAKGFDVASIARSTIGASDNLTASPVRSATGTNRFDERGIDCPTSFNIGPAPQRGLFQTRAGRCFEDLRQHAVALDAGGGREREFGLHAAVEWFCTALRTPGNALALHPRFNAWRRSCNCRGIHSEKFGSTLCSSSHIRASKCASRTRSLGQTQQ